MKVYANIYQKWKSLLSDSNDFVIFISPYLTSKTADTIIKSINSERCEVYTLFNVEVIINKSTSLTTLKKLVLSGYKVYHIPNLHAKVVYSPTNFLTIGSQNITKNGLYNKELTTFITNDVVIHKKVDSIISSWISNRDLITLEMIEDLEKLCPKVRKKYRKLLEEMKKIEDETWISEKNRKEAKLQEEQQKAEKEKQMFLLQLKDSISQTKKSASYVICRVQHVNSGESGEKKSLFALNGESLTQWSVNDSNVILLSKYRYLCLIENTGKLGWARVFKTRITFISDAFHPREQYNWGGQVCKIELVCNWDDDGLKTNNMTVKIIPVGYEEELTAKLWVTLNDINITEYFDKGIEYLVKLKNWCIENEKQVKQDLLLRILTPFLYMDKLYGVEADKFFGGMWIKYRLNVGLIDGKQLLLARKS